MSDNIILFYLFFIVVGFFTAMLGTIIGAGGGIIFVPLFMYWFHWRILNRQRYILVPL